MYYGNSFNCGRIRTGRAVLVAISIPIFTSQLEKSREAVDAAKAEKPKKAESKWMSEYKRALAISMAFFVASLLFIFGMRYIRECIRRKRDGDAMDDFV